MKINRITILLIAMIFSHSSKCQVDTNSFQYRLSIIINQTINIDSLISKGDLITILGCGSTSSSTNYYSNNLLIKSIISEFYKNGSFDTEHYFHEKNKILTKIRFTKKGEIKFELYLVKTDSGVVEILIQGNRKKFKRKLKKIKTSLNKV